MKFGEKLYDLRKKNCYTQVQLAEMLGVTTRTLSAYEKSDRYPQKRSVYQKLSEIFQVPLNYLYTENTASDDFIAEAGKVFGERGRMEAQQLALDLSELFASGELSDEDMDGIMIVMQKAYFKHKEEKLRNEARNLKDKKKKDRITCPPPCTGDAPKVVVV